MRISDWSSDVCSSDLAAGAVDADAHGAIGPHPAPEIAGAADMGIRQVIEGNAVRIAFLGALGLPVDGAAERGAAGCGPEQEGPGDVEPLPLVGAFAI